MVALDALFGLLVVVYIIGSVVAAVLKKASQGPVLTDPFPTKETPPVVTAPAEELEEHGRDSKSPDAIPSPQAALEPAQAQVQGVEPAQIRVQGEGEELGDSLAGSGLETGVDAVRERNRDVVSEGESLEWRDWPRDKPFDQESDLKPRRRESSGTEQSLTPHSQGQRGFVVPVGVSEWQRAFVLAEIIAPPLSKRGR